MCTNLLILSTFCAMRKKHAGDTTSIDGADASKSLKGDIHAPAQSDLGLKGLFDDFPMAPPNRDVVSAFVRHRATMSEAVSGLDGDPADPQQECRA